MVNDVSICNLALSNLVQRQTITAVNPPGSNAYEVNCNTFWRGVYRRALGDADWDFARKRVDLTIIDLGTAQPDDYTYAYELPTRSFSTFTADATTNVLTGSWENLENYSRIRVASATTLPAGLAASTDYYVIYLTSTTIKLASSYANAVAGTAIDITGAGTGTHTLYDFDMVKPRVLIALDDVEKNPIDYRIEGKYIYCDAPEATLIYTHLVIDYTLLSDDFETCAAALMASRISGHVVKGDVKLRDYWLQQYLMELPRSAASIYNHGHHDLAYRPGYLTDR